MKDPRLAKRLNRLMNLRNIHAPRWIIKTEQIALVMIKEGRPTIKLGRTPNRRQEELLAKHVRPLLCE